jgi:hypothetical protein
MKIMTKPNHIEELEIRLRQLEELQFTMHRKPSDQKLQKFSYQIRNEIKVEEGQNLVAVLVHVEVKTENQSAILANFSLLSVFEVLNLELAIQYERNGKMKMPKQLFETLLHQAIATTRGVLFGHLKGTYLQSALLPLIQINDV